ncbi:hypothetical protein [Victivallis sp. Marseille-Q1083]|uniref:hypothetical protein n=1 Tax=Victivallis sp. Marseille-Q1083 TaxID=2717288 RepID=UPI00158D7B88|nr:hypothetical protein [Victivallis sp. Marseille-Q1083]
MQKRWKFIFKMTKMIYAFLFICISCIACSIFIDKIGNVEVGNIRVRFNPEFTDIQKFDVPYPSNHEDIELMEKWLDSIRDNRGSFTYVTFAPTEIELIFDNIRVYFGKKNLIIFTKNSNYKYTQSLKKMDELDFKMKEYLRKIIEKEMEVRGYSYSIDI